MLDVQQDLRNKVYDQGSSDDLLVQRFVKEIEIQKPDQADLERFNKAFTQAPPKSEDPAVLKTYEAPPTQMEELELEDAESEKKDEDKDAPTVKHEEQKVGPQIDLQQNHVQELEQQSAQRQDRIENVAQLVVYMADQVLVSKASGNTQNREIRLKLKEEIADKAEVRLSQSDGMLKIELVSGSPEAQRFWALGKDNLEQTLRERLNGDIEVSLNDDHGA